VPGPSPRERKAINLAASSIWPSHSGWLWYSTAPPWKQSNWSDGLAPGLSRICRSVYRGSSLEQHLKRGSRCRLLENAHRQHTDDGRRHDRRRRPARDACATAAYIVQALDRLTSHVDVDGFESSSGLACPAHNAKHLLHYNADLVSHLGRARHCIALSPRPRIFPVIRRDAMKEESRTQSSAEHGEHWAPGSRRRRSEDLNTRRADLWL
jgi:hypothetical protein